MNKFEEHNYRLVAVTSDKSGFIRVTMHIDPITTPECTGSNNNGTNDTLLTNHDGDD